MATVTADKLNYNYSISGSYNIWSSNIVLANKLSYSYKIVGALHSDSPLPLNPELNVYYDCDDYDMYGDPYQGRLEYDYGLAGSSLHTWFEASGLNYNYNLFGEDNVGLTVTSDILNYSYELKYDNVIAMMVKDSWAKWSKIGSLDFTQDQTNVAGEMPLYKCGKVYDFIPLDKFIIVYGNKSIIKLYSKDVSWGQERLLSVGSIGKNAQIGDINKHWFIDTFGDLYELDTKGIKRIGYKSYLSKLTNPTMLLDRKNILIYICDNTYGFVYSYEDKSLCSCVDNITGLVQTNNTTLVCSPGTLAYPALTFTTGIYDFETRKEKTIFNIELSTASTNKMEMRIAYRIDKSVAFAYTPWTLVTPQGIAYLPCHGREFKFCFKMSVYEDIKIDQLKINGVIHGFSHLDARRG